MLAIVSALLSAVRSVSVVILSASGESQAKRQVNQSDYTIAHVNYYTAAFPHVLLEWSKYGWPPTPADCTPDLFKMGRGR